MAIAGAPDSFGLGPGHGVGSPLQSRRSQVVELRFFGGLSVEETAEVLQVSRHTVMRDWTLARTWLFRELRRGTGEDPA